MISEKIRKNAMSTTTTSFKTKFNSVSNGCSLAALKQHITTCLERWRQKKPTTKGHQTTSQEEKCFCHQHHRNSSRWFGKQSSKEYSFIQHTTVYCKSFNTKFRKLITPQQRVNRNNTTTNCKGPCKYGRKVEIVAKLLSTTLIAKPKTSATEDFGQQTDKNIYRCFEEQIQVVQNSTTSTTTNCQEVAMTVTDLTFMELREEYPDLNSEIRSILTARAQEGTTISQIRDDYRKLTGLVFPIYEDVTEFLLTIPYVTAYCTEKGTRIFNIQPMDKTKHIHDMVTQQKQQPEPLQRPTGNHIYYRERQRNNNYHPYTYRQKNSRRLQQNTNKYYVEPVIVEQQQKQLPSTDSNLSRDGSEGFFENNCCYYQDNCNYLYNRICNQQQPPRTTQLKENTHIEQAPQTLFKPAPLASTNAGPPSVLNNFNTDTNNANHLNNLFQIQQQQHQYQHNVNNVASIDTRRSSLNPFKTGLIRTSRSSSPTAKSWYTNDSAYTDSDYEAHLLDFLLLGDDFFLYMARMELRCKFKKNQRILQSGLCVSGQTIGAAIKRVRALSDSRRSVILNIGSVDLMQGRQLIQIEHDFRELLLTMLKKGITPILTTLAPLANYSHNNGLKSMLDRFNEFIKREGQQRNLVVIDIWKCLVNEKGHVFFDCYQNEPRNVTGTTESYLFWNKIGRQRVLQLIESQLEY